MKKKITFLFIIALFLVAPAVLAKSSEMVVLTSDEVINDAFYIKGGENVDLAGTVKGDVITAGGNVYITGTVEGDVIAAGGNVRILGTVGGNVRAAGGTVEIGSQVGGNVMVFGGNVILTQDSNVAGGVFAAGGNVELRGQINRETEVYAGALSLHGQFNDDIYAVAGDDQNSQVNIFPSVVVNGNLKYKSPNQAKIYEGAQLNGEVDYDKYISTKKHKEAKSKFLSIGWIFAKIITLFSLLAIGLLLLAMAPKVFDAMRERTDEKQLGNMLKGLAWVVVTPIAAIILMITIIGIPLALILLAVYVIALYVLKIFIGYIIGWYVFKWVKIKTNKRFLTLLAGLIIYILIMSIPFIGWLFCLVMTIWVVGMLIDYKKQELKRYQ